MIFIGPVAGLLLGLLRVKRPTGLLVTGAAWALGAIGLGIMSWQDSHELTIGFWVSTVIFLLLSISLYLAGIWLRERNSPSA